MSRPDESAVKPLARHDSEPVFDEPWQAQALGLAFTLAERGVFSPARWSEMLGEKHRQLLEEGAADTPQTYYMAVAEALETLVGTCGTLAPEQIEERTETWRRAYLNTPHGEPVRLAAGRSGKDH